MSIIWGLDSSFEVPEGAHPYWHYHHQVPIYYWCHHHQCVGITKATTGRFTVSKLNQESNSGLHDSTKMDIFFRDVKYIQKKLPWNDGLHLFAWYQQPTKIGNHEIRKTPVELWKNDILIIFIVGNTFFFGLDFTNDHTQSF